MQLEQSEVLDLIDLWHGEEQTTNAGTTLYEFLGWSWEQYQSWVLNDIPPEQSDTAAKALRAKLDKSKHH
jgi:hypothetical protein